ncbi:MAG: hypothetical protein M3024_08485 [Candidatus Dormibacteraeota bacterium]|nr:hypothetical protein [Candidatus Dormibacteraeota bacterium]
MSKFKRASLAGSEEFFRSTRPRVVEKQTEDTITELVERRPAERPHRVLHVTQDEVGLLLDAIQAAKYPDRARKLPLEKFERYDGLRDRLQALGDE